MRNKTLFLLASILFATVVVFAANDPLMGTWKLDVAKSQLGPNPPRSIIRIVEPVPGGAKVTQHRVTADGKESTGVFTVNFDGKPWPISGDPFVDHLIMKRVSRYEADGIGKKDGRTSIRFVWKVSQDGKVLTYTDHLLWPPSRRRTIVQILEREQ
jgi:hypothetical protein